MFASFITGAISAALVIPLVYSVVKAFLGIGPSGEVQVAPPIQEIIHTDGGQYRSIVLLCNFLSTPVWVSQKLTEEESTVLLPEADSNSLHLVGNGYPGES